MGTMTFQLPAGLPRNAARDLDRACLAGGPDNMPWPTELRQDADLLSLERAVNESGNLVAPYEMGDLGRLMGTSATLMERTTAYRFLVELARGKVNQLRCQLFDWRNGGLVVPPELTQRIQEVSHAFGKAVTAEGAEVTDREADSALVQAYRAAAQLVETYTNQVFQIRHQRSPRLDTALSCRLGTVVPSGLAAEELVRACNTVSIPLSWHNVEMEETSYRWEAHDALLKWAESQHLAVHAGPLLDFSSAQLPGWLWLWERDPHSLATFMCRFVESTVRRYRGRIRRWQLTAGANCAHVLHLNEDQLLGLTFRLVEAARNVDPGLEIVIGIAQPWGEYMTQADRTRSPFIFADELIRAGLNPAALDLELLMGLTPRGSYCRDVLEVSRLLDLYFLLTIPLSVTLGYPSSALPDPDADPELRLDAGRWRDGFTPQTQADWLGIYAPLALCKHYVHTVRWTHFSDADVHQFPHCGLVDSTGQIKPALLRLRDLREAHVSQVVSS